MASETKEQILDVAERLFAEDGVHGVSLRTIIAEAEVNLAAVHYHFGSKDALVEAVFERRVGPINEARLQWLDRIEAASDGPPPVDEVLRALVTPAIQLALDPKRGHTFMKICGRFYTESGDYLRPIFDRLFSEIIKRFVAAFQRACPELPPAEVLWRVHFSVGVMVHTLLDSERLGRISGGTCDTSDAEAVVERMVQFSAAGMRTPVLKLRKRRRDFVDEPVGVEAGGGA
ncbi:MAG: TetR/AcrR family transcriptional regulator [Acidobacteria bacterium]|nr:TetR/AcrR family transcriptional regulator [Acidobacteriota bacterium]